MKIINAFKAIVLIAFVLLGLFPSRQSGYAQVQSRYEWTEYENISNTPTASSFPTIVPDRSGNLHVFWSDDVGGETSNYITNPDGSPRLDYRGKQINYLDNEGNTLFYTRWNGSRWLTPVDILTNIDGRVLYPSAAIDPNGVLHVVWSRGIAEIEELMYSKAPVDQAANSRAWSTPVVLSGFIRSYVYSSAITADSTGGLHIIYNRIGTGPGLYGINSFDGGQNWSTPQVIFANLDEEGVKDGTLPVWMMIDAKDRLHATWTRYDTLGNGKAIYYAQSTDLGLSWSNPFEVSHWKPGYYEVDWLSAGVAGDKILLTWEGGPIAYMNERISLDAGATWSDERRIFPKLQGENGWADIVTDSNNRFYQIITKRVMAGEEIVYGLYFLKMVNDQWDTPELIGIRNNFDIYSNEEFLSSAEVREILYNTINDEGVRYQRSAILNGNELFVVVVNEFDGEIYSTRTLLDAPYIAPQPYPTQEPKTNVAAGQDLPTPTITTPPPVAPTYESGAEKPSVNSGGLLFYSLIPVVLFMGFILVFYSRMKSK